VLPARAIENAVPLVYVNRVGVEDGVVFGGGSQSLDARGETLDPSRTDAARSDEAVWVVEIDLEDAARWRPFRPVLRDIAPTRAGPHRTDVRSPGGGPHPPADPSPDAAGRTGGL
jgi:predicted amidohydrolase